MNQSETQLDPSKIMQIGMGFWASKTLLSAVNMGLFTMLADRDMSGEDIKSSLGLHARSTYDFLDTLVALGFLGREGLKEDAVYSNAQDTNVFLDKNKPSYVGGMLEMANNRLYPFWANLEDGLRTGQPQNEARSGGEAFFEAIYADEARLNEFVKAMAGVQMGNFIALAKKFDFKKYNSLCDVGGAGGHLCMQVAMNQPHIKCITYDLPPVAPIAEANIKGMGLSEHIEARAGNFFEGPLPSADVITMGNVLHDWDIDSKKMLLKKAYDALPAGGALIVIENVIDDERTKNAFGLMMSLNMLIETPGGFDFSFSDFDQWVKEAGFRETSLLPLTGPTSAAIAIK